MKVPALFVLVLFASLSAHAVEVRVFGKNPTPILQTKKSLGSEPKTVGIISDAIFQTAIRNEVLNEYQGNDGGVLSINHMTNDIEIISDKEMKAFGWCYSLNGNVSDLLANQQVIVNDSDRIVWFYAYAHYLEGAWVSMCKPVADFSHQR